MKRAVPKGTESFLRFLKKNNFIFLAYCRTTLRPDGNCNMSCVCRFKGQPAFGEIKKNAKNGRFYKLFRLVGGTKLKKERFYKLYICFFTCFGSGRFHPPRRNLLICFRRLWLASCTPLVPSCPPLVDRLAGPGGARRIKFINPFGNGRPVPPPRRNLLICVRRRWLASLYCPCGVVSSPCGPAGGPRRAPENKIY